MLAALSVNSAATKRTTSEPARGYRGAVNAHKHMARKTTIAQAQDKDPANDSRVEGALIDTKELGDVGCAQ